MKSIPVPATVESTIRPLNIIKVDFDSGEYVSALYIDGELWHYGDYYHDKIDDWIKGFLNGLKFAKISFQLSDKVVTGDLAQSVVDNGNIPPKKYEDTVSKSRMAPKL